MRTVWLVLILGCVGLAGFREGRAQAAAAPKPVGWLLMLDKPYSGVRDYDRDQRTGDGRTLRLHEVSKYWRDSAGRLRQELTKDRERVVWTYLTDPAAKVQYRWNNEKKIVYVMKIGDPVPAREPAHPLTAGEVRDVTTTIDGKRVKARVSLLPIKTIDGQQTQGVHQVAYSDADRKTVFSTTDTWTLLEYRVALDQVIVDDQYGRRVFHFASFKPGEPKAELFQVPKGYVLKPLEDAPDTEQFE